MISILCLKQTESITQPALHYIPDSDGVPEARQQFLHIKESCNLLKDESNVSVQVVHRPHFVVDTDGWSQRVGQRIDQIGTVVVV